MFLCFILELMSFYFPPGSTSPPHGKRVNDDHSLPWAAIQGGSLGPCGDLVEPVKQVSSLCRKDYPPVSG